MALIYPVMIPAAYAVCMDAGVDAMPILYNTVACVLAGSVLGDHCSPISDTTILSSLACSCNHINHVRTQMPYALTVGAISLFIGIIPGALGVPSYITLPIGIFVAYLVVRFIGKPNKTVTAAV
jgi:Na+/H+ antiporter NhaC